ncbi:MULTISPECIES: hypothetical protein [unclassified Devosia]|uniref:hypothetical protein n=1 Tax=unclassified Devosia TaxID=196773 RepID=UPI000868CA30|nr:MULTISPECIES: hypothetical protein [unclassified Devosia]MBN9360330.1 hypothetical protein [Devosia sp.]ODS96058.1 MAG: hypothetical protein ABS47_02220 [Devosia sp. SCN 66-27]OJX22352.1 MAG: hypothetical protein BGO83_16075 [Devosia sp. 66-14]
MSRRSPRAVRPFFGLIDAVIAPGPAGFDFDGGIAEPHAQAAWTWMVRDVAPDLIDTGVSDEDPAARQALDLLMPELLQRSRAALAAITTPEAERRMQIQFGSDDGFRRLPVVLNALKCRSLLDKAQAFGRAANAMTDETALGVALQSMPLNDHAVSALLFQAAMGQVTHPGRLMAAAIRLAGSATEGSLQRAGFAPLIEAILSHAQAQIPALDQHGAFADIDLTCRAIDRFHRLMRAVTGYVELGRLTRWSTAVAAVTKTVSELVEPKLREVSPNVNLALRRHSGTDRLDSDQVLAALNGCYVLATIRDCRDSLALNAMFDQTWTQVGQALEMHVQRNLELFRQNPGDRVTGARLDAAIKMAELRFNPDYADVLRRARETAEKRAS